VSIESVPAAHRRIFLSVTYSSQNFSFSEIWCAQSGRQRRLGICAQTRLEEQAFRKLSARDWAENTKNFLLPNYYLFFQSSCATVGDPKVIWIRPVSWCLKNCKIKTKTTETSPVQEAADMREPTNKLTPGLFLQLEEVEG